MGDMADMLIEQGFDMMIDGDMEDEYSGPWGSRSFFAPRQDIVCKYCKEGGMHWGYGPGGWRLFTDEDELHGCLGRVFQEPKQHKPKQRRRKAVGLFTRNPIYVSDRGDEFQLEDMAPSHLLNAINHHKTQIETLDWILEQTGTDAEKNQMLHLRRISLHTTVEALVKELRNRDPDLDHEDRL